MDDGFAQYVAHRHDRLCRTTYLMVRDWATAEDLVQTALARAWLAWHRLDGDPDPYVYRIIVNTHASWWRRRWRGELPTRELPDRADHRDAADEYGERELLWRAIGGLSPRQRAVVVLHYYEQLPLAQVAGVLGCSIGAVKAQLNRALTRLRVHPEIRPTEEARPR